MNNPSFYTFETRDALAAKLANDVADYLTVAINERGTASLMVSGGSTPQPFFVALQQHDIAWDNITISLADERWVMPDHDDSTEKLIRAHLLTPKMHYLSLAPIHTDESLEDGAARIERHLQAIARPFDVVVLGMGEDGHTASLFPHHCAIDNSTDALCLAINNSPKPPAQRISLSPNAINSARHTLLHITGDTKKTIYEEASQSGNTALYPIAKFIPNLSTYWAA